MKQKQEEILGCFITSTILLLSLALGIWHATEAIAADAFTMKRNPITTTVSYNPNHYLSFAGNISSYAEIPRNHNLDVSHFSVAFWAKRTGSHHDFDSIVSRFGYPGGKLVGWAFDTAKTNNGVQDRTRLVISNGSQPLGTGTVALPLNTWAHIVGTFNGTILKLYKDGILAGQVPFKGSYSQTFQLPVRFAAGLFAVPSKSNSSILTGNFWKGDLSDIRIYNRPISESEVSSLFGRQDISNGLIGHWKLDQSSGNKVLDSSGNGNDGIIHNAVWKALLAGNATSSP